MSPGQRLGPPICKIKSITNSHWAKAKDLWFDCAFKTYAEHVDGEPTFPAVVSILCFDGPLYSVFNCLHDDGSYDEFCDIVYRLGYEFENSDGNSIHFYAIDADLSSAFSNFFHWQWVCKLVQPDCDDVYEELCAHFARRPRDLHRLSWREFETLLYRIFQNQGFQAELGPGRGDEGVDVRLLQRDPIGDVMTLVQAKKYAGHRKVRLEAVAALHGISLVEGAQKSIFVTTSAYEPVAQRFAARTSGSMKLASSEDVAKWCEAASAGIIADVSHIIDDVSRYPDHRIVHAHTGVT
jgi:hypothetical protein